MEGFEKMEIKKGINLIYVENKKFKTNLVSVYIKRPLVREEATKNALLPYVLKSGSKGYENQVEISRMLDELYGSKLVASVGKKGERHIMSFRLVMTNDKFIDEDIFEKGMDFLKDIIFNPLMQDGGFKHEYFDIEAQNLRDAIRGRINDKAHYAVERCIEEMCSGENYSIHEDGYEDDIDLIDRNSLYEHYENVISTSPVDVLVVGDIERDRVISSIKSLFDGNIADDRELVEIPEEEVYKIPEKKKEITEHFDVTQGKVCIGFRTNIHFTDKEYYPLALYSSILGGGAHSKMFLNIREKESLCYYIYSSIEKYKALMFISSGIEIENYEKALKLIDKEMTDMKKGRISDEEMENSKNAIVNSLMSMTDSIGALSEFYYGQLMSGIFETPEQMIQKIKAVTKAEVAEASKKIKMDTVYFLRD